MSKETNEERETKKLLKTFHNFLCLLKIFLQLHFFCVLLIASNSFFRQKNFFGNPFFAFEVLHSDVNQIYIQWGKIIYGFYLFTPGHGGSNKWWWWRSVVCLTIIFAEGSRKYTNFECFYTRAGEKIIYLFERTDENWNFFSLLYWLICFLLLIRHLRLQKNL